LRAKRSNPLTIAQDSEDCHTAIAARNDNAFFVITSEAPQPHLPSLRAKRGNPLASLRAKRGNLSIEELTPEDYPVTLYHAKRIAQNFTPRMQRN
jgi:hypothetical protein